MMFSCWKNLTVMVLGALLATACAAGGGGGAGSFGGGYPGGPAGSPCVPEGAGGCTFDGGLAYAEACSGGLWAVTGTCTPGAFCSVAVTGVAQCTSAGTANTGDAAGTGGGQSGGDTGSGSNTGSGNDTGSGGTATGSDAGSAGSGTDAGTQPKPDTASGPQPLLAQGSFSAAIDGGNFTVDYTGMPVTAAMVHRLNSDPSGTACISSLLLSVAKPDGSCRLDVVLSAGYEGEGLRIDLIQFFAKLAVKQNGTVVSTIPCAGWTQEPSSGEVIYQSVGASGGILLPPLNQPLAGQSSALLKNQLLAVGLDAPVNMKFLGRKFNLDLSSLSFAGDLTSTGDPAAPCAKTSFPMPKWSLVDVNPGSPGYKNTYGLDAFKGKKIVVALVSDWCNSCRAQSQLMQKLQDQAIASGHTDVQMVLIADKQKSDMTQLTKLIKNIPLFSDTAAVDAWTKMNAAHAGKLKASEIRNSGYGYAKNGKEIMYFAPNGTGSLNLTAFQQAVMTVVNAAD